MRRLKRTLSALSLSALCFLTVPFASCSSKAEYRAETPYALSVTTDGHGDAGILFRGEGVTQAAAGEKLFVACVPETGYEPDQVTVNGNPIEGFSFEMPTGKAEIAVTFKQIVREITVVPPENGTITCDKTSAAYGETVVLTVRPAAGYHGVERSLLVNNAEIFRGRIYHETQIPFVMPTTDVTVTATFEEGALYGGENVGDYSSANTAFQGEKWDFSADAGENPSVSVTLSGNGDGENRDASYVYFYGKEDYFCFSATAHITDCSANTASYENYVGVFFGNGTSMGRIGYYYKKHSGSTDMYLGRNYYSYTFASGKKKVISGFQALMKGEETYTSGTSTVSTSYGGLKNIPIDHVKDVELKMGFVYDAAGDRLHILMSCFGDGGNEYNASRAESELIYVRTVKLSDISAFYTPYANGKVNFGLYAESAFTTNTITFSDYRYTTDRAEIEAQFPALKA